MQMCASVSADRSRCGPLLAQSETTEPFQVSQCWVLNYWSGLPNPGVWSAAPWFSGSIPTHNYHLKSSWRCYCPQQNTNSFKSVLEITVTFQDSVQLLSCVRLFATPWTAAHQASLPSPTPGACSNSCPSSRWYHPTISFSVTHFCSHLQSFPASRSFSISNFFTSGGQNIGALASILPMNIQDWFPLGLTGLIYLQFKGHSTVFSNITVQKHQLFSAELAL